MPVWTGAENLGPTGIQSPDRPIRSNSRNRWMFNFQCDRRAVTAIVTAVGAGLLVTAPHTLVGNASLQPKQISLHLIFFPRMDLVVTTSQIVPLLAMKA